MEALIRPIVERTGPACRRALKDAGLGRGQLDGVILVGGATRTPLVRAWVEELFGTRAGEIYPYLGSVLGVTLEPDAAARVDALSPEALQYRTFEVLGALLARLAEDGPVVCAIEDLHWADPTSVQLAERTLPLTEDAAVLLVLSMREERDHPCWALKELAAREYPHLDRELALEPLSGDAERELLESLTGAGTLPDELARRILAQAEGNPFFLEELVRSLIDAGALVRDEGGWRFDHEVAIEIPQTVERVIVARIDRLDATTHSVLTAAAALGRRRYRSPSGKYLRSVFPCSKSPRARKLGSR
jgi:predicted ATPase